MGYNLLEPKYASNMNWLTWVIIGGVLVSYFVVKRLTLVRPEVVRDSIKRGAKVIDVRSEEEFQEKHLPGAINIPLNRLSSEIARHVPDKEQPVLLHCLSGGRSGIGKAMLKRMGYQHCFNLGSYSRAQKLLEAASKT